MNKKINLNHPLLIKKVINTTAFRYIKVAKFLAVNNNSRNPLMELAGMEKSKTGKVGLNVDEIYNNDWTNSVILALENIRSLWNIGAILRTAEFFGIKEVWLVGYTGREREGWDELHHKIAKTALGAEKNLEIKFLSNSVQLIKLAEEKKLDLIAIEQDKQAIGLREWQVKENSILVFGSETEGVSKEVLAAAEQIVEIPRLGKKNSLNVATAAGIVLARVSLFN